MSQDRRIKKYIRRHKGLTVIPRFLSETIPNSKRNLRPKVDQMKRVIVEMVAEEYGVYVERAVTGFI